MDLAATRGFLNPVQEASHIAGLVADILICLGSGMAVVLVVLWIWHVIRQVVRLHPPN